MSKSKYSFFNKFFKKKISCRVCGTNNEYDAKFCEHCTAILKYYDAFISYRRESGSILASLIKNQLENIFDKQIFLDVKELQVGRFDEKLLKAIEETPHFILILSPGCLDRCVNRGDWLKQEIMHAIKTNRNFIPVITDDFKYPDEYKWKLFPNEMRIIQSYHAMSYNHNFQEESIKRISDCMRVKVNPYQNINTGTAGVKLVNDLTDKNKDAYESQTEPDKEIINTTPSFQADDSIPKEKNKKTPLIEIGEISIDLNEYKNQNPISIGNISISNLRSEEIANSVDVSMGPIIVKSI